MQIDTFICPDASEIQTYDQVTDVIDAFCNHFEAFLPEYSFAHIVLDDYNLSDGNIRFCLKTEHITEWITEIAPRWDHTPEALAYMIEHAAYIVRFLGYLLSIPESIRETPEEEY